MPLLFLSSLLLFLVSITFVILTYRVIIYPAFISPLRKVPPAHWTVPFSPLWILIVRLQGRENRVLHLAHQKLGRFVRVGPNELSVNDAGAVRTIYQGGFEKTVWYSIFDNYGVPCMFSTVPVKEHSLRKRMISNVYSKSYIQSSQAAKEQAAAILHGRLLPILEESSAKGREPHGIDIHSMFLAAAMDLITAYIFGLRHSTDFLRNLGYREHWLQLYKARANYPFWRQELPRFTEFMSRLGLNLYPTWVDDCNRELGEWNKKLCTTVLASGVIGEETKAVDEPVVTKAMLAGLDKEAQTNGEKSILYSTALQHHDLSVASELFDHILAGQETAGITLTYLVWELSRDQDLQRQLQLELRTLDPGLKRHRDETGRWTTTEDGTIPDLKALDSLELLHAVLMETLRLHAAIPGPQPRQAPHPSCRIGPYEVPGGTRVSALAHTLHREEAAFPEPEVWDHTRWLGADEEVRKVMNRQFWAFGSGGRMCIGSNFAMNEMKLIFAAIYSNYTTHIVDDAGIEQDDGYIAGPKSGRLWIRLEPLV
ncbi:hypothetical protein MCOR25_008970 [Pyricularia grisea]|nr:hypothetical protein MCOR25_008970 [Pyricularia grisea]